MDSLWIRYGSSNRKAKEHSSLLIAKFGELFRRIGSATLGAKAQCGVIPDTPENRAWVKQTPGITIQRR